ncbi:MAG: hypothetical protein MUC49_13760 [Raineya sp.]|jgi:hypothetical protein|nr:hypothetical protein [Raineya sp.]
MFKKLFPRQKILTFLFEVLVIFSGITLSFVFDKWKQNRDNEDKQTFYLQSIQEDLEDDIKELEADISVYEQSIKALQFYTRYNAQKNPHPDSLVYYYAYLYRSGNIFINTAGFDALKSTGSMTIISDKQILKQIIKIYQNDFPKVNYWNGQFVELKRAIVLPFFTKREIFLRNGEGNFSKLYQEAEFYNILYTVLNYNKIILNIYKPTLENCRKLHQQVGNKLKE